MPPKKSTKASMKGKANADGATDGAADNTVNGPEMPPGEVTFLLQCFKHLMGDGPITIDCTAVAKERGQLNPRSIGNRIAHFRKTYGFPIIAGNTNGKTTAAEFYEAADSQKAKANADSKEVDEVGDAAATASDAEVVLTPAKRATAGTKRKAAIPRKPAANKRSKKVKAESDVDQAEEAEASGQSQRKDSQDSKASVKSKESKASASDSGTGFTPVNAPATVDPGETEEKFDDET